MILATFLPIIAIIIAANLGESRRGWRIATYLALLVFDAFLLVLAALAALAGLMAEQMPELRQALEITGPGVGSPRWPLLALSLAAIGLLSAFLLLPFVRRSLARYLPLRADSVVHTTALACVAYLIGNALIPLALYPDFQDLVDTPGVQVGHWEAWQQTIAFVALAWFGVGAWFRRDIKDSLRRLGLRRPTWRHLGLAVLVTILFIGFDIVWGMAWRALWPENYSRIGEISEGLLGNLLTPLGAVTLGLSAGLGEETLFRGALLPRFGLIASSLLFTVGHIQYAFSPALVEIFLIGLILGILRQRTDTTTTIAAHSLYNFLGVVLIPLFS